MSNQIKLKTEAVLVKRYIANIIQNNLSEEAVDIALCERVMFEYISDAPVINEASYNLSEAKIDELCKDVMTWAGNLPNKSKGRAFSKPNRTAITGMLILAVNDLHLALETLLYEKGFVTKAEKLLSEA